MQLRLPVISVLLANRSQRRHEAEYRAEIEAARKRGDLAEVSNLQQHKQLEDQMDFEDGELLFSKRITQEALALRVPLPTRPHYSEDHDSNECWEWSNVFGQYYLTPLGVSTLRDSIRREREARRSARNHWIAWIGALTGLVGAVTGLVAVIDR